MRNVLIVLSTLALCSQAAFADHHRGRGGDRGGDHRGHATWVQHGGGHVIVDHRGWDRGRRSTWRAPARWSDHRVYVDHHRDWWRPSYMRPVVHRHYYDRYRRPALIVEQYDPVPGYVWVRGHWDWNRYEWIWVPGYYQPAASVGFYVGF